MGYWRAITGLLILMGCLALLLILLGAIYSPNQFYGAKFVVGSCKLITETIDPANMSLVSCDCGDDENSCTGYYPCLEAYAYWYDNKNLSLPPKMGLLANDANSAKMGCLSSTTCTDSYSRNSVSLMRYWEALSHEIFNDMDNWFQCFYHDEAILMHNNYSIGKGLAAIIVPAVLIIITYFIILWLSPSTTCYITFYPCLIVWLVCCVNVIWESCLRDPCRSLKRKLKNCCGCCYSKKEETDDQEMAGESPPAQNTRHPSPDNFSRSSSSSSSESEEGGLLGGYKPGYEPASPKHKSPTLSDRYPTSYTPPEAANSPTLSDRYPSSYTPPEAANLPPPSYNDVVDSGDRYEAPTSDY